MGPDRAVCTFIGHGTPSISESCIRASWLLTTCSSYRTCRFKSIFEGRLVYFLFLSFFFSPGKQAVVNYFLRKSQISAGALAWGSRRCGLAAAIWQRVREHWEQKQTNPVLSHNTNNSPRTQWMQYISHLILHPKHLDPEVAACFSSFSWPVGTLKYTQRDEMLESI